MWFFIFPIAFYSHRSRKLVECCLPQKVTLILFIRSSKHHDNSNSITQGKTFLLKIKWKLLNLITDNVIKLAQVDYQFHMLGGQIFRISLPSLFNLHGGWSLLPFHFWKYGGNVYKFFYFRQLLSFQIVLGSAAFSCCHSCMNVV